MTLGFVQTQTRQQLSDSWYLLQKCLNCDASWAWSTSCAKLTQPLRALLWKQAENRSGDQAKVKLSESLQSKRNSPRQPNLLCMIPMCTQRYWQTHHPLVCSNQEHSGNQWLVHHSRSQTPSSIMPKLRRWPSQSLGHVRSSLAIFRETISDWNRPQIYLCLYWVRNT